MKKFDREKAKKDGFYDGRFSPKVFKDKKKEARKRSCRKWKQLVAKLSQTW